MENKFEENKDFKIDDVLGVDLNSNTTKILHFEPIVAYLEHIESGLMLVSLKWCEAFQTYLLSKEIIKDLELLDKAAEDSI